MIYPKLTNKLNRLKSQRNTLYYHKHFNLCENNMKSTRKLIGTLIHRKTKGQSDPTKIIVNNQIYTTNSDVVNQLDKYFVNPLTPKISLEVLHTICLKVIVILVWRVWYWIN